MEQKLVGRKVELEDLNKYLNSEKSEFLAVLFVSLEVAVVVAVT